MRSLPRHLLGLLVAAMCALPLPAIAGGSFGLTSDLEPILNQPPDLKAYLYRTLDINSSGSANRIGNNVNPRFGGRRIGPYQILAKPKGQPGGYTFELTVNTDYVFLVPSDQNDHHLSQTLCPGLSTS